MSLKVEKWYICYRDDIPGVDLLKYLMSPTLGCKEIGNRKTEFVA